MRAMNGELKSLFQAANKNNNLQILSKWVSNKTWRILWLNLRQLDVQISINYSNNYSLMIDQ